jgi:hypothetical protein
MSQSHRESASLSSQPKASRQKAKKLGSPPVQAGGRWAAKMRFGIGATPIISAVGSQNTCLAVSPRKISACSTRSFDAFRT